MILECPYCKKEILTKYPIKNNKVDDRDMEKVCKHMEIKHPKVQVEK